MSRDLNLCHFIGRLGKEPETKYMPSGDAVTNISIACGWKTKDKEGVEWVPIVFFGKVAEIAAQYLRKGSQVYVSGRFRTQKWQDKEGKDRYRTEIVADTLQMLGSKPDGTATTKAAPSSEATTGGSGGGSAGGDFDDPIPFGPRLTD